MDQLLTRIHHLSARDTENFSELHDLLCREETSLKTRAAQEGLLGVVTATLHQQAHSLGVLHLLAAQSAVLRDEDTQPFFAQTDIFLRACTAEQIRIAPKQLAALSHAFTNAAVKLQVPMHAIAPLRIAIHKLAPTFDLPVVTPLHADFLQVCIQAGCYHLGAQMLDSMPVCHVDVKAAGLTPLDYLKYWYYAGVVYIGQKRFRKAVESFKFAITTPAQALSAVVISAYKKMILVSLIADGAVPKLPAYTANIVSRSLKTLCKTYTDIATAFEKNGAALQDSITSSRDELMSDNNMGLAKQVVEAFTVHTIRKLTACYITLSLDDIASNAGLTDGNEAERMLLAMIQQGSIRARIDDQSRMVSFDNSEDNYDSPEATQVLEAEMTKVMDLSGRVEKLDIEVSKSRAYIAKVTAGSRMGGISTADAMDDLFDAHALED